jgi:hypothetical protein
MLHWFFINGYGLCCFTSSFSCSSLLGMICVYSRHASLVHHYLAWFVLFHFMLHWFIITVLELCYSTSPTGSSLLNMICYKNHIPRITNSTWYYPNVPWKQKNLHFFSEQNLTRHFTWACWDTPKVKLEIINTDHV